jgi:signal transduction histidine kinase
LHNLINNACKYSSEGSPVFVEVRTAPAAGTGQPAEAIITVKDQGHGISPEDQPYIFDRFYRVRNQETARTGGLGLGLFISHEIIQQHQGRMWLESQPGQGSVFYIALPLTNPSQKPAAS